MRTSIRFLALLGLAGITGLTGCSYSRVIINAEMRELDPSSIVVGRSTHMDVLELLGTPNPVSASEGALKNISQDMFRYTSGEETEVGFTFPLGLILPFRWQDSRNVYELIVEFDERGVVSDIYSTTSGCVWRPFEGEGSRPERVVENLGRRTSG